MSSLNRCTVVGCDRPRQHGHNICKSCLEAWLEFMQETTPTRNRIQDFDEFRRTHKEMAVSLWDGKW